MLHKTTCHALAAKFNIGAPITMLVYCYPKLGWHVGDLANDDDDDDCVNSLAQLLKI